MSDELTAADIRRFRQVADRDEIRQLVYRYAWCLDSRDILGAAALFVGREKVVEQFEESMGQIGVSVLFVGNHIIDFDFDSEDEAHGLVYCRAYIEDPAGEEPGRLIEQAILYRDTYRRDQGVWKFRRRIHELWFGVELSEQPLQQPAANWPASHTGLGTVPYGEPTWQAFWARRRPDATR